MVPHRRSSLSGKLDLTKYRTDPISRRVYYLRFCIFGCGYYSSNYPSNTPDKKIINIFFLRFDMINKLPLEHISIKLLLMAPFYVWKVKIFRWGYYSTASTIRVGTAYHYGPPKIRTYGIRNGTQIPNSIYNLGIRYYT